MRPDGVIIIKENICANGFIVDKVHAGPIQHLFMQPMSLRLGASDSLSPGCSACACWLVRTQVILPLGI